MFVFSEVNHLLHLLHTLDEFIEFYNTINDMKYPIGVCIKSINIIVLIDTKIIHNFSRSDLIFETKECGVDFKLCFFSGSDAVFKIKDLKRSITKVNCICCAKGVV